MSKAFSEDKKRFFRNDAENGVFITFEKVQVCNDIKSHKWGDLETFVKLMRIRSYKEILNGRVFGKQIGCCCCC